MGSKIANVIISRVMVALVDSEAVSLRGMYIPIIETYWSSRKGQPGKSQFKDLAGGSIINGYS